MASTRDYEGIVEVVTLTHINGVNSYLEHGYRLLHIDSVSAPKDNSNGLLILPRRLAYVLGRTADVDAWEERSREERLRAEAAS
jgi:hypothetical protein